MPLVMEVTNRPYILQSTREIVAAVPQPFYRPDRKSV
jgi:hypothetical protein